jgi:uncharacterized protein YbjT (DUF2867 family)
VTPYHAVIAGATGAVGGAVVRALLESPRCGGVVALARRPVTAFDALPGRAKLTVAVIDYANLESETAARAAECAVAFCTVGIGQPRKVSDAEFRRVDVEYAGAFARGAARAGVRHLSLLSAIGSDASSRNRYVRTKGEAEAAVIAAGVPRTSLFRPSLLVTDDIRYGVQDRLTQALFPLVALLLPRRFRQIHVTDLGRAMQRNAEREAGPGVEYLYYPDYVALLAGSGG